MARRRGFAVATLRQGQRRATEWGASAIATAPGTLAASTIVLDQSLTGAALADVLPATIVRVRGELSVASDQDAANEFPFGAMGFHVANENARAAGAGSLLRPVTDAAADNWFVHQFFHAGNFGASTGSLFANPWHRYQFDSKAMRKIQDGDAIVVMVQNSSSADGLRYSIEFRILFKLH